MRNKQYALSFSVVYEQENGKEIQRITNFRLMDGIIYPPSIFASKARQYFPIFSAAPVVTAQIYRALAETDWVKRYDLLPLEPMNKAIRPITQVEMPAFDEAELEASV